MWTRKPRRQPDVTGPLEVTLLRKPGCGLCDEAEAMLRRLGRRIAMRVTLVDIDSDAELQSRYFLEIPVVLVNGREIACAPIRETALEDALRDASERGSAR